MAAKPLTLEIDPEYAQVVEDSLRLGEERFTEALHQQPRMSHAVRETWLKNAAYLRRLRALLREQR